MLETCYRKVQIKLFLFLMSWFVTKSNILLGDARTMVSPNYENLTILDVLKVCLLVQLVLT